MFYAHIRMIMSMVCLAAALFLTASTSAADPVAEPRFTGDIIIGATFPLSGEHESYGQSSYYGANTRVKLINAAGGINGKRLVLKWRDNGSNGQQAVKDVRELVEKYHVPAILGPLFSDSVIATRDVAEELKVVILSPLATIEASGKDKEPWVFSAGFSNIAISTGMITFEMKSFGAKTCAVIYDSRRVFAQEMGKIFENTFVEMNGSVVGRMSFINEKGEKDYATPLKALAAKNPDFIFVACYALEATEILRCAKEENISIRFCAPDSWDNELVFDGSGTRLIGTAFASSLYEQEFNYRPFQTFFSAMEQAGMDNPDAQAACSYDAVSLLALALAKGETPADIRKGLLGIKRASLATGRVSMQPNGIVRKPLLIRIVEKRDGRLVPVFAERFDP